MSGWRQRLVPELPEPVLGGLLLLWTVILLQGTLSQVTQVTEPPFPYFDKLLHFAGWGVLGYLSSLLARNASALMFAWVLCTAFGLVCELGQIPIPGRSFEWLDLAADALGAAAGAVVVHAGR